MDVYLYAEGGVTPAVYDYDLSVDGILSDGRRQTARGKNILMIVLKRGEKLPTKEQQQAINNIKAINPSWRLTYYFQREK